MPENVAAGATVVSVIRTWPPSTSWPPPLASPLLHTAAAPYREFTGPMRRKEPVDRVVERVVVHATPLHATIDGIGGRNHI
jgi:hypothetical protein